MASVAGAFPAGFEEVDLQTSNGERSRAVELMKRFDNAMLVTVIPSENVIRSRPMAVGAVDDDGTMWFVTNDRSPKIGEIAEASSVNVAFQSSEAYVSVSGLGTPVEDRAKVRQLWREPWRVWFPEGPDQQDLCLIRVDPWVAEFWDQRGTRGLRYAWKALKAYASGERIDDASEEGRSHGKVEL